MGRLLATDALFESLNGGVAVGGDAPVSGYSWIAFGPQSVLPYGVGDIPAPKPKTLRLENAPVAPRHIAAHVAMVPEHGGRQSFLPGNPGHRAMHG